MTQKNDKLLVLVFVIAVAFTLFSFPHVISYDQTNVSTTVNITNAKPEVLNVEIYDNTNINLTEGSTTLVWCNVSVLDYNGFADISNINATFWHSTNTTEDAALNNNSMYRNGSCSFMSGSGWYANYTCGFDVYYYAYNGTWNCNVTVNDTLNYQNNGSNTSTVLPLYAFNMSNLIDYGDLAVEDTSTNQEFNITNWGNQPINVSVYGYGSTTGDGLAMVCQVGNISIANERYDVDSGATWATMTALTGAAAQISGLTIDKQTDPATEVINATYWSLYVPPNPFGVCNGTVIFEALAP